MVQVFRMHRDAGDPDYQHLDMQDVRQRARQLAPSNEPAIPNGILAVLDEAEDEDLDDSVDKAATPAERVVNEDELCKEMERARPLLLFQQRDSDAGKDIDASHSNALSSISELQVRTGSALIDQFVSSYMHESSM